VSGNRDAHMGVIGFSDVTCALASQVRMCAEVCVFAEICADLDFALLATAVRGRQLVLELRNSALQGTASVCAFLGRANWIDYVHYRCE